MGTGIVGVVLTLAAVSGLREAVSTYMSLNLSNAGLMRNCIGKKKWEKEIRSGILIKDTNGAARWYLWRCL